MVDYLPHCTFNLNPRAASIDTPLMASCPPACRPRACRCGDRHCRVEECRKADARIFGDEMGYLPWQRPGFDLGLKLGEMAEKNPEFVGVVLGGHGLFTWGDDGEGVLPDHAYASSTRRPTGSKRIAPSRPSRVPAVDSSRCQSARARRGAAPDAGNPRPHLQDERKIGHFTDAPEVLDFVNAERSMSWRRSAHPVPIISCAPRSGRWCCPSIPSEQSR